MPPGGVPELDAIVDQALGEDWFAGVVLRVEARGRPVYERAAGWALRDGSRREAMEATTLFDLASLSKIFTATAALSLVTGGTWELSTPAADLLGLPRGHRNGALRAALAGIDLRALLAHSSGLHYWFPFYTRGGESFETILGEVLAAHPPRPGTTIYSDLNFMILGKAIERATGLALPEAMKGFLFAPLGLQTAHYRPRGAGNFPPLPAATEFGNRIERRMTEELGLEFPLWRDEGVPIRGEAEDGNCFYYFGGAAGHAGIFCDAQDLCALGGLYLDRGKRGRTPLIDEALAEQAVKDSGAGRGLGFQLGDNYPGGGYGHTGFTGTYLYLHDGAGLAVAVLTNRLHVLAPRDINPFRREIARACLDLFSGPSFSTNS